jgi:hypothetical protein
MNGPNADIVGRLINEPVPKLTPTLSSVLESSWDDALS